MFISEFKPYTKNTLRAFFTLNLPSGIIIRDCMLHESHGKRWIGLPAKPFEKPDGTRSWIPVVDIKEGRRQAFNEAVLKLVDKHGLT